jgi:dipeptidyl aminopeptidase/acylaminoacyl peptidase
MDKTNLAQRLAFANRIAVPDDWAEILRRAEGASGAPGTKAKRRRAVRIVAAFATAALFAGAVVWARVELRSQRNDVLTVTTSSEPSPVEIPVEAIVFSTAQSDRTDAPVALAAVSAAGGPVIPLPTLGGGLGAAEPAWSRDGQRLAFVGGPSGHIHAFAGDGDIYVMSMDGSSAVQVTSGLRSANPSWSPDGTRLVYVEDQGQALVVIDTDGTHRRVIARDRGYYQLPSWSPDGGTIAFQSSPEKGSDTTAVFTIRPDGTDERQLTDGSTSEGFPTWSPDGSRLAFSAAEHVWIMRADGSNARQITACGSADCVADFFPTWSPSGTRIAFIRQEEGGASRRLYVLDLVTGETRGLTPDLQYVSSPTWRPT